MKLLGEVLCAFGSHSWMPVDYTAAIHVRRCRRCPRVEAKRWLGPWKRARHLENDRG